MIVNIDDWKLEVYPEQTRQHSAYSTQRHCTCAYCENYYRALGYTYPGLKPFLDSFGINHEGPVEMYPFEPTICLVSYRVTGKILKHGLSPIMVSGVPVLPKSDDERHFLLEVGELELPWIMLEDPNEVISPANEPEFLERMYERMFQRRIGEFVVGS